MLEHITTNIKFFIYKLFIIVYQAFYVTNILNTFFKKQQCIPLQSAKKEKCNFWEMVSLSTLFSNLGLSGNHFFIFYLNILS